MNHLGVLSKTMTELEIVLPLAHVGEFIAEFYAYNWPDSTIEVKSNRESYARKCLHMITLVKKEYAQQMHQFLKNFCEEKKLDQQFSAKDFR